MTEADICRIYITPALKAAGWTDEQIREQVTFTAGRIIPVAGGRAGTHTRQAGKRADYLLRYTPDFPIAVVEAKDNTHTPGDGLQQAMDYAETLGLRFAYSSNGQGIVEHDYTTGVQRTLTAFPSPDELWRRLRGELGLTDDKDAGDALFPFHREVGGRQPRYYQEIAVNRAVHAVLRGQSRILLTMATGTGKTFVAFQIVWKLWKTRRKTRILFLADRNVLVDQAKDRTFTPLGDAAVKLQGRATKSREVYFAIYQAIADRADSSGEKPGLFRKYPPDFFDLIIVDECHRGSAAEEGSWRQILEYFASAAQIGMTATPRRKDNVDTYAYFGDPIYTYSLATGIDDGFLAPYRVLRVVPSVDATGWRPTKGELDRFGREIPDEQYGTKDFERLVSLLGRTRAVARHLAQHLRATDPMAKTIVFCVDQEHADDMRLALAQESADLVRRHPHYVARVVSDEGKIGRGFLDDFQDPEKPLPVIVTTSQMLTTGVDAPTVKNVVLFKAIKAMTEFKQIIGRGTRVAEDFGKLWFTIVDYTGATGLFADPEFDGDPVASTRETIDEAGAVTESTDAEPAATDAAQPESPLDQVKRKFLDDDPTRRRKFYVDGVQVWITTEQAFELDAAGNVLRTSQYTDYTRENVRRLIPSAEHLRDLWPIAERRAEILAALGQRGVDLEALAEAAHQPEADPLDLLLHVAFNAPLLTRGERARALRSRRANFFNIYTPAAREVLDVLLDKYADFGLNQLVNWNDVLKIPPLSEKGTLLEIAALFGGPEKMKNAVDQLQALLYSAEAE